MDIRNHRRHWALGLLLATLTLGARAETYALDWDQELAKAAAEPERYAIARPVSIDATRDGRWSRDGEQAVWRMELTVPGAQSLAFHASQLGLPAQASLSVGAQRLTAAEAGGGDYWSRPQAGDQLSLEARMPLLAAAGYSLRIDQLQAGFRDPQASAPAALSAKAGSACAINFSCSARNAALEWGQSVVAITVLNAIGCTATLVNNSLQDGRPYLLTASHCRQLNGVRGDPQAAAASVQVYWNAVSPCGSELAAASSSAQESSSGAYHRAESSDVWLLELKNPPPAGAKPYWAGIDASDQPASGELTGIHHGGRLARQIVWGSSAPTLTVLGLSIGELPVWKMLSELGAAAAGSSGSALFVGGGKVVGVLSASSNCDAYPLPSLYYSRLAPAWTGDGSSGGSLRPWLDPANLGRQIPAKSGGAGASTGSSSGGSTVADAPGSGQGGGGAPGLLLLLPMLLAGGYRYGRKTLS